MTWLDSGAEWYVYQLSVHSVAGSVDLLVTVTFKV